MPKLNKHCRSVKLHKLRYIALTKLKKYGLILLGGRLMRKNEQDSKKDDLRSFSKLGKVCCVGVVFNVPGSNKQLTIPAFTPEQMLGALKVVDALGNDFQFAYRLAGFIFERVTEFRLTESKKIPSNMIYAHWLQEFRVKAGLITGRYAAVGTA